MFEAGINAVGLSFDLQLKVGVSLDAGAAGSAYLDEGELTLVAGVSLKKAFDGLESLEDALGVIDAINADAEERCLDSQLSEQRAAFLLSGQVAASLRNVAGQFDADRERLDGGEVIIALDGEVLPIDARLEDAVYGIEEIVAVTANMEADEIRTKEAIEQFALPRADFKRLRCGPGDVPEDCDARLGEAIFQHPRQQGKMIVLNKDHGILFAGDFLDESVGKLLVDCVVVFPIRSAKDGAGVGDVAERPETFIGKSVIVASFLLAA